MISGWGGGKPPTPFKKEDTKTWQGVAIRLPSTKMILKRSDAGSLVGGKPRTLLKTENKKRKENMVGSACASGKRLTL